MAAVLEKRKERRVKVNLPIKIVYRNNPEVVARTENISGLGAYVEIDREISPGTQLDITLEVPVYTENLSLAGEVKCKGNIFRCNLVREFGSKRYYGIGIFFTDFLDETNKNKLFRYIDFLILKDGQDVKKGLKRWRDKRDMTKKAKQIQKLHANQEEFQAESLNLLRQILTRLDEISRQLKSQDNPD